MPQRKKTFHGKNSYIEKKKRRKRQWKRRTKGKKTAKIRRGRVEKMT